VPALSVTPDEPVLVCLEMSSAACARYPGAVF
jgi:hypothetical protein